MIIDALKKVTENKNLSESEIKDVMGEILEGRASDIQISAFLIALRMKGETIDEIVGACKFLKEKGGKLDLKNKNVLDIVGTGGDGANTFNISTASAFVIASGGVCVAKHGSRAASSKSGAADVLEQIGANIMLGTKECEKILEKTGICFIFAPKFNPLMKNAANVRKEIKIRTIFNCLGPLINPSGAETQVIGVYDKKLVNIMAHSMVKLGCQRGMVLFGETGLDEASVVSKTYFAKIENGKVNTGEFSPEDFNIKRAKIEDLRGGEPDENAKILKGILKGEITGAKKDAVALNSGAAFYAFSKTKTLKEGVNLSYKLIENGDGFKKLMEFVEETKNFA